MYLYMDVLYRLDNSLMAVVIVLALQVLCMTIMLVLKRPFAVSPPIESIVRALLFSAIIRLNRRDRADFTLMIRGTIVFSILMATLTLVIIALEFLMGALNIVRWYEPVVLALFLGPLAVMVSVLKVSSDKKTDEGFYRSLVHVANKNLVKSDVHAQRRIGCAVMMMAFVEWMIAPIMIYVFVGLPALILYASLSLFIRGVGQASGAFVFPFYWLYVLMRFIPSLMASLMVAAASIFTTGGKPLSALKGGGHFREMPLATLAYAQNIILGGASQNRMGEKEKSPWLGPDAATAKLDHRDVIRVCIHYGIALFLSVVTLFLAYVSL